jgi:hypothetical protein
METRIYDKALESTPKFNPRIQTLLMADMDMSF